MDNIDWVRLWLLNRTIYMRCQTSLLTHDVKSEGWGYWSFPGGPAVQAGIEARIAVLRQCVEQGLIHVYPNSWLQDTKFHSVGALDADDARLDDEEFLMNSEAVTSKKGHQLWESEFRPDWSRFWQLGSSYQDDSTNEVSFYVTYASNNILDELIQWLPRFLGLEDQFGLINEGCHTYFGYQATKWKIIPYVKVVTWRGSNKNQSFAELLQIARVTKDNAEKDLLKKEVGEHFKKIGKSQQQAIRVLTRLSQKWDCHWDSKVERNESFPVLLETR